MPVKVPALSLLLMLTSSAKEISPADVAEEEIRGCPDDDEKIKALEEIRSKAFASVDLLKEINGFVNKDLMNP